MIIQELTEQNGVVVIVLSGKIMGGPEATEINDRINQLLDENKKHIVIDLEKVEWMNSSGLGILIGAINTVKANGGQLKLINASEKIQELLRITKLLDFFDLHDSLQSAIDDF